MKFVIKKRARFTSSMLAGVAIIALAVWGWGLPISTVLVFLAVCVSFLVLIICGAAIVGWALGRLRSDRID